MLLDEFSDSTREQVANLQESLASNDAILRSIYQDSYATLGSLFKDLLNSFLAGLNKLVSQAFSVCSDSASLNVDSAFYGITFRFLMGAA